MSMHMSMRMPMLMSVATCLLPHVYRQYLHTCPVYTCLLTSHSWLCTFGVYRLFRDGRHGPITSLTALPKLRKLRLNNNRFSGRPSPIYQTIDMAGHRQYINHGHLSDRKWPIRMVAVCSIAARFGSLLELEELRLENNLVVGEIPASTFHRTFHRTFHQTSFRRLRHFVCAIDYRSTFLFIP